MQLGYDTLMPLLGLLMLPVTLLAGPAVSYNLLVVVLPGAACYTLYRVARLWLPSAAGAVAAGALFGLSTMVAFQDWFHLNIAAGTLFRTDRARAGGPGDLLAAAQRPAAGPALAGQRGAGDGLGADRVSVYRPS